MPLYKGGLKDPDCTDSYRAIAGSSLLLKLFDNVILIIWGDRLGTDSLQFGFKAGTSTTECSWMVMEVANYFLRKGTSCIMTLLDCSKAFDMCKFSTLFEKLHKKGLPAIVLRSLVFVYEEQTAWVTWGRARSVQFRVVNGTRQGSILSPAFFSIYIDDLLVQLRKSGVGCHIGDVFYGAAGYADDIVLLAPCRSAMSDMLRICENFARENNLKFSTDSNPAKSKSKCLYMVGPKVRNPVYPAPLQLYGQDLPWVVHATHLGHEFHQDCTMEMDIRMKRAAFIKNSSEVRTLFKFALPTQVLNAISVYSAHFYGAMLWDLSSDMAGQVYRSWNTCVKLVWDVPRSTHNYFVEHLLAKDFASVKEKIFSQYTRFVQKLRQSTSKEVRILQNIVKNDVRSVTGRNCLMLAQEFDIDPNTVGSQKFKDLYQCYGIPGQDLWRISILDTLLQNRYEMTACGEDTDVVSGLIQSLCSS